MGEEDGAGLEVEGCEEGFGDADGGGVVEDKGREARGEDLDFWECGGRGVEGGDELGV